MRSLFLRPFLSFIIILSFVLSSLGPIPWAEAQDFLLPAPGVRVGLSPESNPPILKGIKVHPEDPFKFEFILDTGDSGSSVETPFMASHTSLQNESTKLIKYFLASLTIPEGDLWVNLSPYEKDRIIPKSFGLTEMGRDLLAEDYMLKQITASLIYPEGEIGKKFWQRIYEEAAKKFGTTNIPVNTFNKVWIVPEKAVVYENAQSGTAYVVESKLKVMLEQDYLSLSHNVIPDTSIVIPAEAGIHNKNNINALGSNIVREIVLPELNKEVNEGKNFSQLRQVYNSLILAAWYKKKIKDSILAQVYANKNKVAGVNVDDPKETQRIYQQYLRAFKKGVYNYIKEDLDPITQETVPRKYFSGGMAFGATELQPKLDIENVGSPAMMAAIKSGFDKMVVAVRVSKLGKYIPAKKVIKPKITSVNELLARRDERPDILDVVNLIKEQGLTRQQILEAAAHEGYNPVNQEQVQTFEKIMDALQLYLDRFVENIKKRLQEKPGLKVWIAGRDGEILYDALKLKLTLENIDTSRVYLMPTNDNLDNELRKFSPNEQKIFFQQFGVSANNIDNADFLLLDTGFNGSFRRNIQVRLQRAYDIKTYTSRYSSYIDRFQSFAVSDGTFTTKTGRERVAHEEELDVPGNNAEFNSEQFGAIRNFYDALGLRSDGVIYSNPWHFECATAMEDMPKFHDKYEKLIQTGSALKGLVFTAVPRSRKMEEYDTDLIPSLNSLSSKVSPVAAILLQYRLAQNILASMKPTPSVSAGTPVAAPAGEFVNRNEIEMNDFANIVRGKLLLPPLDIDYYFKYGEKKYGFGVTWAKALYRLGPIILVPLWGHDRVGGAAFSAETVGSLKAEKEERLGDVYPPNKKNILFIPPYSAVPGVPLNDHTAAVISSMLDNIDQIRDSVVIDQGAGSGVLSLVALSLGAKKAILVENSEKQVAIARALMVANGYTEGVHFDIIQENLTEEVKVVQSIKDKTIPGAKMIGLVNIGAWPTYGNANASSLKVLSALGVDLLINGGFLSEDSIEGNHKTELENSIRFLNGNNFDVQQFSFTGNRDDQHIISILVARSKQSDSTRSNMAMLSEVEMVRHFDGKTITGIDKAGQETVYQLEAERKRPPDALQTGKEKVYISLHQGNIFYPNVFHFNIDPNVGNEGGVTSVVIDLLQNGDLTGQHLGTQLYQLLSSGMLPDMSLQEFIKEENSRMGIANGYIARVKNKEKYVVTKDTNLRVVDVVTDPNNQISMQTVLAGTLMGKILISAGLKDLVIETLDNDGRLVRGAEALWWVLKNSTWLIRKGVKTRISDAFFLNARKPGKSQLSAKDQKTVDRFNAIHDGRKKNVEMGSGDGMFLLGHQDMRTGEAIIGYEIDPVAVKAGMSLYPDRFGQINLVQGDAGNTGLDSNSVDKVIINMPNPTEVNTVIPVFLREAGRILKSGGEVLITMQAPIQHDPRRDDPNYQAMVLQAQGSINSSFSSFGFEIAENNGQPLDKNAYPESTHLVHYKYVDLFRAQKTGKVIGQTIASETNAAMNAVQVHAGFDIGPREFSMDDLSAPRVIMKYVDEWRSQKSRYTGNDLEDKEWTQKGDTVIALWEHGKGLRGIVSLSKSKGIHDEDVWLIRSVTAFPDVLKPFLENVAFALHVQTLDAPNSRKYEFLKQHGFEDLELTEQFDRPVNERAAPLRMTINSAQQALHPSDRAMKVKLDDNDILSLPELARQFVVRHFEKEPDHKSLFANGNISVIFGSLVKEVLLGKHHLRSGDSLGDFLQSWRPFDPEDPLRKDIIDFHGTLKNENYVMLLREFLVGMAADQAMGRVVKSSTGGIDLNAVNKQLQVQNAGEGIKFHLDPAQLALWQDAAGVTPVIISVEPLKDISLFLGV